MRFKSNAPWFHLSDSSAAKFTARLDKQLSVYRSIQHGDTGNRVGQCLEIAIYRALLAPDQHDYFGGFTNLDDHDDSRLYSKEEPPQSISGNRLSGNQRLGFLVRHPDAG